MCEQCLEDARRRLLRFNPQTGRRSVKLTAVDLERHAKKYGPDQVAETAAELGLNVKVERPRVTRKRAKGPTLRERVAGYVAAGHTVETIAEQENLSPSRARRLVEEVSR